MRWRWLSVLLVPVACSSAYGTEGPVADAGPAPVEAGAFAAPDAGDGPAIDAAVPAPQPPCFLCDDFDRTTAAPGWKEVSSGNASIAIKDGHLVGLIQGSGSNRHAYLQSNGVIPSGAKQLTIDLEYEVKTIGPFTAIGGLINLLVVAIGENLRTLSFSTFGPGADETRVTLKCESCMQRYVKTTGAALPGRHKLSFQLPLAPSATMSASVDGMAVEQTFGPTPALPDATPVEIRLGVDQELNQTAPIEIHYDKLALRFE